MPNGIKHIEFWVSDLDVSLNFYQELFKLIGWEQVDSNGFSDGFTKIYFLPQWIESPSSAGPRHICFLASSPEVVDQVGQFLRVGGYTIIRGPINYPYNQKTNYTVDFKDPDGYILEVATRAV